MRQYRIGDLRVQIDATDYFHEKSSFLDAFRHEEATEGEILRLRCSVEPLETYLHDQVTGDNGVYVIYRHDGQELLSYHWGNMFHGFLIHPDRFAVTFAPRMHVQPRLPGDWFFSVCSFHRQLLARGACVLHASYIEAGGKAILFSAPSGTGKSTQAALWETHVGAQIINGDRALLRIRDGRWHAFGYPCCGSSGICLNRTLPLGALVILEQGSVNRVTPMSAGQKIRALAAAMEFYQWDEYEMNMVFDLAARIAGEIPVLRLVCRPDADAVRILKDRLTGEGILYAD